MEQIVSDNGEWNGPERRRVKPPHTTLAAEALAALPSWARPIVAGTVLFGAPTVIAFFLIYFMATTVTRDLNSRETEHKELSKLVMESAERTHNELLVVERTLADHHAFDMQESRERIKLLRAICIRLSKDESQRMECQTQ